MKTRVASTSTQNTDLLAILADATVCSTAVSGAADCASATTLPLRRCVACGKMLPESEFGTFKRKGTRTKTCLACLAKARKYDDRNRHDVRHILRHRHNEMIARCQNPDHKDYKYYANVNVCSEWQNPDAYIDWVLSNGFELHLSVDRIDRNGDYSPENCRVVSSTVQARNRSNNIRVTSGTGESTLVVELAEDARCVVCAQTLGYRIRRGYDIETAMTTPPGGLPSVRSRGSASVGPQVMALPAVSTAPVHDAMAGKGLTSTPASNAISDAEAEGAA